MLPAKNPLEALALEHVTRGLRAAKPAGVGHDPYRSFSGRGSAGGPGVGAFRMDRRMLRGVGADEVQSASVRACNGDQLLTDPTSPSQGGMCVVGQACEYDPAIYCGWTALPFSTYKSQGNSTGVDTGPVLANFGGVRTIRITAERACKFRIRGLWFRAYTAGSTTTIDSALIANAEINRVPRTLEVGSTAPNERIGIPSNLFDGTFWVLPVDWGTLSPIQNNSRPLELQMITPSSSNVEVIGVLFGDPISENNTPHYGNKMAPVFSA
jgi:hypothetical protein